MADQRHHGAAGAGDPVQGLLHGVTVLLDDLAAVIAGSGGEGAGTGPDQFHEILGHFGVVAGELGELLAGIISALIAVLETVAELLRGGRRPGGTVVTGYEQIPVRIAMTGPGR